MSGGRTDQGILNEKIKHYRRQKTRYRYSHQVSRLLLVVLAALIPYLTTVKATAGQIALVGLLLVAVTGVDEIFGFGERYLAYRISCKQLDRVELEFDTATGRFSNLDAPARTELLVELLNAVDLEEDKQITASARESVDR
jgi:hypothetical protein